ncbi:MAG: hypothetical protein KKF44_02380 [Nanoarchaeota archaeon]|nr:hypothetical protein [Nanoarchaeota archaeon]
MSTEIESFKSTLNSIKEELDFIKNNMITKEDILSGEEFVVYKKSFKKVNLVSFEDAKKELGL